MRKRIPAFLCVFVLILSFTVSADAIGFDPETAYGSVFVIHSGNSLGSGFAIGENAIITNAHVISNKNDIRVVSYSGNVQRGFIVAISEKIDIAVIGVPGASLVPLKCADLSALNIGDDVYAIGAPNSLAYTLTKGVVSSKDRYMGNQKYIQTDAAINTGNSGGPLLNDSGEVVGVNSYKMNDSEGIGLAVPIDVVLSYLNTGEFQLNEYGNISGPVIEKPESEVQVETTDGNLTTLGEETPAIVYILAALLLVSVVGNIILIVLLTCRRKKERKVRNDPSERTDFDIEIIDE